MIDKMMRNHKDMPKIKSFHGHPETMNHILLVILLVAAAVDQVGCSSFNYTSFPSNVSQDFKFPVTSNIAYDALQVTMDARGASITNLSGRILRREPFKLWNRKRGIASFNTTFVLNIRPETDPGGEGIAFILTKDAEVPQNSYGQWLGIVNDETNGSSTSNIVAVEFDTKKSFPEDIDNNHVGIDVNSVYSINQTSLHDHGVNISSGTDVAAMINYDGSNKTITVFVLNTEIPIISMPLDLSLYLPEDVYVGFSASTGTSTELNCVKAWYFSSVDIESGKPLWFWGMISLTAVILLLGLVGLLFWIIRHRKVQDHDDESSIDPEMECSGLGPQKYRLKKLRAATGNFNDNNELGRGGFGRVYKGYLEGREVAVKRTTKKTRQGKQNLIAEVTTIGNLHHRNLVKLIGWCYERNELLLVYEFMRNGSLDKFIFPANEQGNGRSMALSWERRHSIICGVAQALDYLHNGCTRRVLHRDIKTSNIMLDSEFNPCLGDFGLARMFKLSEKTHHSTKEIAGTPGYMAPEIFHTGRSTAETDVYSFGILVLEVTSGRWPATQAVENGSSNGIVDWLWELHGLDLILDAIDPRLNGEFDKEQAECMMVLGLACCHPNPYMRPSIKTALQVLMEEALPPLVPLEKPAFVWPAIAPPFNLESDHSFSGGTLTPLSSLSGR
ncbi:hypothetical protein Ancab_030929 [Ancistrocladus abbreviatus]